MNDRSMSQRLLTPSKITAWLDCRHYLTLRSQVDDGQLAEPDSAFGSFAELLLAKGLVHEAECLEEYERDGKTVLRVAGRRDGESFQAWVDRVGNPLADGWGVVYQMPFLHNGIRGIADFLLRVVNSKSGAVSYEPVDAKLARAEAKPGHVLQLCFYAEAIEALTGVRPERMHIWLGSGQVESLQVAEFAPLWRRLRGRLDRALADGPAAATVPESNPHCAFCEFQPVCDKRWRDDDSLTFVAGIRKADTDALVSAGVATLAALAGTDGEVADVRDERLTRLRGQAALQLVAREAPDGPPPYTPIEPGREPWGHGFEQLPEPTDGDVFLDFEGHPFWRADTGLFFLFGLLEQDSDAAWRYRAWWADDLAQERTATAALIDHLARRRAEHPGMHVYHYNNTERTELLKLAEKHGVGELALAELVDTGTFVDLLPVARNSVQVGVESYGLKHLERLTPFVRRHEIDRGAGAVVQYDRYMDDHDSARLDAIAAYNEDDVRATRAVRDWLVDHRPAGLPWRDAYHEVEPLAPELNEVIARLHGFEKGSDEHTLGDLLAYWRSEWFAYSGPKKAQLAADPLELLDAPDVIADLRFAGETERFGSRGQRLAPGKRFTFPRQDLDRFSSVGDSVLISAPDGTLLTTTIDALDPQIGSVDLQWGQRLREADVMPPSAVLHDWVNTKPKQDALQAFAEDILEEREPNPVTLALLRRDRPRFAGAGPRGGVFTDDLAEMADWVTRLDHSFVTVQGPPGTGKTYRAARLVRALVRAGKRVGITAFSHHAIGNVLEAVIEAFEAGELDASEIVCKSSEDSKRLAGITYSNGSGACANLDVKVVAGTTWLFASKEMRAAPVDVLLIDEAGQLALADALAASGAAHNVVLLGDPLQLPQVAHATHPGIAGRSVLEHVLDKHVTLPAKRGIFLGQTRRMHPDVCGFISDLIYQGRLHGEPRCAQQTTVAGTGLRWLRAEHQGNRTSSIQEAELIAAELARLIGTYWTNFKGKRNHLGAGDFMVVAPYNNQVKAIRRRLDQDPALADVPVGTVDKFQGREAAVVFFSMTASSGEDVVRGKDFLFSRNRLNVAVSRARCLAYLVCTDELLDTPARTVAEMRLIATLNAFVEVAAQQEAVRSAHRR